MRIEIVTCDVCGGRVDGDHKHDLSIRSGVVRVHVDICEECAKAVAKTIRKHKRTHDLVDEPDDDVTALKAIRRRANIGLEAYASGATANDMAKVLRDILSDGRKVIR